MEKEVAYRYFIYSNIEYNNSCGDDEPVVYQRSKLYHNKATAEKDAEWYVHKLEREYGNETNEKGELIYFRYDVFELEFAD